MKTNTGANNAGDYNSGDYNSGYYNSGNFNSGDYNSGGRNSGYYNSGDYNSGNFNSGWFNTNEPKMRMFNKDTDITYSEFCNKYSIVYPDLHTCKWVYAKDMTDTEKSENKNYEILDGYLKRMNYKEAWEEYWNRASDEDKKFFTTLPNFDASIFKEITGIDVEKQDDTITQAIELLKKNGYKIIRE